MNPLEKRVDATCDRLFGDDSQLACAYKMVVMNATTAEYEQAVGIMQSMNAEFAAAIDEELQYTLDASGNVVPVRSIVMLDEADSEKIHSVEKA